MPSTQLRSVATALLLSATCATFTAAAEKESDQDTPNKPNILLTMADDLTFDSLGCYGSHDGITPNIDRLAGEGMLFERAFTATAMCAPTRQQLYTGIFPVRNGAYPNHSKVKPGTKSIVHYLRDLGYRVGLCGKKHFGPPDSFPFETINKNSIVDFIGRDENQPFCLIYTSHSPHLPWSEGDPSRYDPAKLSVPPYLYDNQETREAMCKYFAEVTDFDREVGECVKLVKEAGVEDNTIVICTTEQGAQFPHGKWTCYDVGLHVGLIIRWPDRVLAGSTSKAMVQYVDVVPTLIDAAGGKPVDGLDGRSFLPVLLGKTDKHNEVVYGVHTTRGIIAATPEGYPIRSIRTETHKYIMNLNHKAAFHNVLIKGDKSGYWNSWVEAAKTDPKAANLVERYQHRPAEEFYDIVRDPYELENLANDPTQRERMDELRQKLESWMDQQGDKGLETELQRPLKEVKPSKPVKNEAKAPRLRKRADRN